MIPFIVVLDPLSYFQLHRRGIFKLFRMALIERAGIAYISCKAMPMQNPLVFSNTVKESIFPAFS